MRSRAFASSLLLLSALGTSFASVDIQNLGVDASLGFEIQGDLVAVRTSEAKSGNIDLNNDGDTADFVLQVVDARTGLVRNTGLEASGGFRMSGGFVAFTVLESRQGGADLNGDGDSADFVQFVFDASTGTVTNVGLASTGFRIDGNLLAFTVSESGQGGVDRNGDGDARDAVLHLYDLSRGTLTNVGLDASGGIVVSAGRVAFAVSESAQGAVDLNGDGDALDSVLHVVDAATGLPTNLGRATQSFQFQIQARFVAFVVRESSQGSSDLNGDLDAADNVLHVHDTASGTTTNLGRAVASFQLAGDLLAFAQPESGHRNQDANGDGDAFDDVIHLYDLTRASLSNLAFAIEGYQIDGRHLAFGVREFRQGNADRNGDGDTSDLVLHLFDVDLGTTANLGIDTTLGFKLEGDMLLAFGASEASQGVDLNGDGDIQDFVLHVFDIVSGTVLNLAVDPSGGFQSFQLDGKFLTFGVREAAQGGIDLNQDNDAGDVVLHFFGADSGEITNLGMDVSAGHQIRNRRIAFAVTEANQGMIDLNGDGDAGDIILHLADLSPASIRERIEALIAQVRSLGLPRGIERSRVHLLEKALRAYDRGKPCKTMLWLRVFKLSVRAQKGKKIATADAVALRDEARAIIGLLREENPGCKKSWKKHKLCR